LKWKPEESALQIKSICDSLLLSESTLCRTITTPATERLFSNQRCIILIVDINHSTRLTILLSTSTFASPFAPYYRRRIAGAKPFAVASHQGQTSYAVRPLPATPPPDIEWRLRKNYLNCRPGSGKRGEKGAIVQEEWIDLARAVRSMTRSTTNDHRDSL